MSGLRYVLPGLAAIAGLGLAGCWGDMYDQPKYLPYGGSRFFANGMAMRHPPAGTVPRGAKVDPVSDTAAMPVPITAALLRRGQEAFTVNCSVCHGALGDGGGMIVRRGFPPPPSFHLPRLQQAPDGHFYAVITHGYGLMYDYAERVSPADRWAVIAYIRALQLSQHAPLADLPPEARQHFQGGRP